eukprot:811030_1
MTESLVTIIIVCICFVIELALFAVWLSSIFKCGDFSKQNIPSLKNNSQKGSNNISDTTSNIDVKIATENKDIETEIKKQTQLNHKNILRPVKILVTLSTFFGLLCNLIAVVFETEDLYGQTKYCVLSSIPTMFLQKFFLVWYFLIRIETGFRDTA